MSRHICEVIDKLLEVTPESEVNLLTRLKEIRWNASFTAPESMRAHWAHMVRVMVVEGIEAIPPRELNDWQRKFCKIVTDCEEMPDEEWLAKVCEPHTDTGQVPR